MSALVELTGVCRSFRIGPETINAVHDVTLSVAAGEMVAIGGPSGSGKTRLLKIIGLLDAPSEGRCLLGGRDLAQVGDDERTLLRNRRIGFVFQHAPMLPRWTAVENVALPLRYRGLPRTEALRQAGEMLARVGLERFASHRPHQLSGGQLQRAGIARALIGRPDLVLADEPTAALEPEAVAAIRELFQEWNRTAGTTFILVTHQPALAAACHRRLTMQAGRLGPFTDDVSLNSAAVQGAASA